MSASHFVFPQEFNDKGLLVPDEMVNELVRKTDLAPAAACVHACHGLHVRVAMLLACALWLGLGRGTDLPREGREGVVPLESGFGPSMAPHNPCPLSPPPHRHLPTMVDKI